jgi:NTP pyrophosphatase (non-canonical NTP hydrolase)
VDIAELQVQARRTRETYARETARRYGRSWRTEEYMLGFVGDVGDLAKLVQGKAGVRPRDDLDEALAHELADCLWSILTLADCYEVDLEPLSPRPCRTSPIMWNRSMSTSISTGRS